MTRYRLLEEKNGLCRMELCPVTGRTHQLRVHCLAMGIPMLGDPQYCTGESRRLSERYGFTGQQLMATELCLPHPMTKKMLKLTAFHDIFLPDS